MYSKGEDLFISIVVQPWNGIDVVIFIEKSSTSLTDHVSITAIFSKIEMTFHISDISNKFTSIHHALNTEQLSVILSGRQICQRFSKL